MPQLSKLDKLQQRIDALRLLLNDAQAEYAKLKRRDSLRARDRKRKTMTRLEA